MSDLNEWLKGALGNRLLLVVLFQIILVAAIVWLWLNDRSEELRKKIQDQKRRIGDLDADFQRLEVWVRKSVVPSSNDARKMPAGSQLPQDNSRLRTSSKVVGPVRPQQKFHETETARSPHSFGDMDSKRQPQAFHNEAVSDYPLQTSHELPICPPTRCLYAKSPEADGTFKAGNLQPEPSYDSLYVLSVDPSGVTARVELHGSADGHQTAVQSPTIYLDPVCTYERQPQHNASRIRTVSEGTAVLDGERWRMRRDLQIEFI